VVEAIDGLAEWQRRARLPLDLVCLARWRRWLCYFDLYMALVGRSGIGMVGALKRIACGSSMESEGRWWAMLMMVGESMYFYDVRTTDDVLGMRAMR
jgi:hypothetical protein